MGLLGFYRVFHPTESEHTFFSAAHGTFFTIDHMLAHTACLNKCGGTEIILCILHKHMEIEQHSPEQPAVDRGN